MRTKTSGKFERDTRDILRDIIMNYYTQLARECSYPWPATGAHHEEMYASAIGEQNRAMLLELANSSPRFCNMDKHIDFVVMFKPTGDDLWVARLILDHATHGSLTPIKYVGHRESPPELPVHSPYHADMVTWLKKAWEYDQLYNRTRGFVAGLLAQLGTYGQLLRLWPSLADVLGADDSKRNAALSQDRKSPLPQTFTVNGVNYSLWELRVELEKIDEKIAYAILVATAHGVSPVRGNNYDKGIWPKFTPL